MTDKEKLDHFISLLNNLSSFESTMQYFNEDKSGICTRKNERHEKISDPKYRCLLNQLESTLLELKKTKENMLANNKNAEDSFKELFRQIQALFDGASVIQVMRPDGTLEPLIEIKPNQIKILQEQIAAEKGNEDLAYTYEQLLKVKDIFFPIFSLREHINKVKIQQKGTGNQSTEFYYKRQSIPQIYKDALFDISLNFELIEKIKNIVPNHTFIGSFKSILDNVPIKLENNGIYTTFNLIKDANIYHELLIAAAKNDEKGRQVIEAVVDTISQLKLLSASDKFARYQQVISKPYNSQLDQVYVKIINDIDVQNEKGRQVIEAVVDTISQLKLLSASEKFARYQQIISKPYNSQLDQVYVKIIEDIDVQNEKGRQVIKALVDTISQLKLLSASEKFARYQQVISKPYNSQLDQVYVKIIKDIDDQNEKMKIVTELKKNKGLSWQLKFAFNRNKLKLLIATLVNLIGCSLIISLGSLGLAAAMTTVGFFSFNLLIQLIGYGFDELIPNNKLAQNLLSPLLQIGLTVGLVFATLALFPAIGPSIWILMTPIEISYAIKITMQITSSYKNLDVSTPSTSWRKKLTASLPLMITAAGTGLVLVFTPELFQPLTLHYGLALIGCYIAIQVIIYSLDIIKQPAARAITQFLVNIGLSAALIGILLPLMPVTSIALQIIMISTLAFSGLIRLFLNIIQDNSTNQPEVSSILNTEKPETSPKGSVEEFKKSEKLENGNVQNQVLSSAKSSKKQLINTPKTPLIPIEIINN
jgi:KaiC/GvpD/RAD55 family RecA-like ATPase